MGLSVATSGDTNSFEKQDLVRAVALGMRHPGSAFNVGVLRRPTSTYWDGGAGGPGTLWRAFARLVGFEAESPTEPFILCFPALDLYPPTMGKKTKLKFDHTWLLYDYQILNT